MRFKKSTLRVGDVGVEAYTSPKQLKAIVKSIIKDKVLNDYLVIYQKQKIFSSSSIG